MNAYDKLSPLTLADNPSLVRVPVVINSEKGEMTVFVGDAHIRIYTNKTLPDHMKASISQIHVIQGNKPFAPGSGGLAAGSWMSNLTGIEILNTIGWRVHEGFFVVIVDYADFDAMRGVNDFIRVPAFKHAYLKHPSLDILEDISKLYRLKRADQNLRAQYQAWSRGALEEEYKRLAMTDFYKKLVMNQVRVEKMNEKVEELLEKYGNTREQSKSEG